MDHSLSRFSAVGQHMVPETSGDQSSSSQSKTRQQGFVFFSTFFCPLQSVRSFLQRCAGFQGASAGTLRLCDVWFTSELRASTLIYTKSLCGTSAVRALLVKRRYLKQTCILFIIVADLKLNLRFVVLLIIVALTLVNSGGQLVGAASGHTDGSQ